MAFHRPEYGAVHGRVVGRRAVGFDREDRAEEAVHLPQGQTQRLLVVGLGPGRELRPLQPGHGERDPDQRHQDHRGADAEDPP